MNKRNLKCSYCGSNDLYEYVVKDGLWLAEDCPNNTEGFERYVCANCYHIEKFWFGAKEEIGGHIEYNKIVDELKDYALSERKKYYDKFKKIQNEWIAMVETIFEPTIKAYNENLEELNTIKEKLSDDSISVKEFKSLSIRVREIEDELIDNRAKDYEEYIYRLKTELSEKCNLGINAPIPVYFIKYGSFRLPFEIFSKKYIKREYGPFGRRELSELPYVFPDFCERYNGLLGKIHKKYPNAFSYQDILVKELYNSAGWYGEFDEDSKKLAMDMNKAIIDLNLRVALYNLLPMDENSYKSFLINNKSDDFNFDDIKDKFTSWRKSIDNLIKELGK